MTKFSKLMSGAAPMVLGLAMVSAPAYAQDEEAAATKAEDVIVVTGSRITNPNLELSSPVGVVTSQELELRQTNTAEQFLRELPSAVPSIGSAVNNGNGGASFVNLRGVGSVRNLVLLDGRRFVPADTTGRVDLNSIPLAVIERTDILTGGATTTYGADAIGGVVNFITKRNFSGLEANLSEQITEQGDGNVLRADVTIGANFDDGRGNVVLSVGYQEQDAVFQGGRSFSEFNVDSFSGTAGGSSNAVPAVIIGPGIPGRQITADGSDVGPFDRPFNFNPFNIFQTPFERFNIYGSGRYEVSDAVEVYTQAVFSKQTVSTIIAPGGSFFNTYQIPLSNPFIPTAILNRFCTGVGLDAAGCAAAAAATGPTDPNYQEIGAQVRRRSVEAGTRDSNFTTQLFNIVAGVRGNITDNISWDVSGSYGESDQVQRQTGFARFTRLQQSLRASDPGACADTSNGCVPINLFGVEGTITQPMIDFVFSQEQTVSNLASIATANANITGDLGFGFAETPIAFAVGGEYRKFTAQQRSDDASKTPGEVVGGGGAAPDIDGQYDVYDAFGELVIPLLEGKPFFENLTVELGGRYSKYSSAGEEFTWKAGGSWEPVVGLKIRGNYQRSSRAPNIGELFTPVVTGLSNLANDPCQGPVAPTGNLLAACLAQVPAGSAGAAAITAGLVQPPAAGQINITTGGNPNLGVEKATTWTVGAIFQPDAVPGFSVSVDYFNIKVTDAISAPTVGDSVSACFGAPSGTNPFCQASFISRSATTGGLDGSPNEVLGLILQQSNLGKIATDGIDFSLRYTGDLTDTIKFGYSIDGTWTHSNKFQASPTGLDRECVGFYSVSCPSIQPEFSMSNRFTFTFDEIYNLSVRHRFISATQQEPQDIIDNGAAFIGNSPLFGQVNFTQIPAENYFDLSGQWNVSDNVTFTVTVQNLFDNKPSVVGSTIGSTAYNSGNVYPSTYDALGRRYGASVKFSF